MSGENKRQMPKGGRKGGRQFPQINLKDAVEYAKKLVSKTHTGAQPEEIILKGVFGSSGPSGKVRASAMKQFGLMSGTADAYKASELGKKLVAAPPEDQPELLRQVLLKPAVFNTLYETFKGDAVSAAKIRQQASTHEVHPDNLDKCVNLFIESVEFAGVGTREGDNIQLQNAPLIPQTTSLDMQPSGLESIAHASGAGGDESSKTNSIAAPSPTDESPPPRPTSGRAVIHVNIGLDSSLDTEKLEKQLELLRRYGAI